MYIKAHQSIENQLRMGRSAQACNLRFRFSTINKIRCNIMIKTNAFSRQA